MAELRLIDANALKTEMADDLAATIRMSEMRKTDMAVRVLNKIDEANTIDAVPVVRCRECVHNEDEDVCPFVRVNRGKNWFEIIKPHPDGFCHMGAKMDGGAEG